MEDKTPLPSHPGSGACHLGLCSMGVPRSCLRAKGRKTTARPEYQKEKDPGGGRHLEDEEGRVYVKSHVIQLAVALKTILSG